MARSFGGSSSDLVTWASGYDPPSLSTFTHSAWVNPASSANGRAFLGSWISGGNNGLEIRVDGSTNTISVIEANIALIVTSTATVSNGTWSHVAVTCTNPSGGTFTIYINGTVDNNATGTVLSGKTPYNTASAGNTDFYNGSLADSATWNVVLSAAEIKALAKGARPIGIRPKSIYNWLPLNGASSPEPDLSGNANNGTLTGTANASGPPLMQFTPRWPQVLTAAAAAATFQPAWAMGKNVIVEGFAT